MMNFSFNNRYKALGDSWYSSTSLSNSRSNAFSDRQSSPASDGQLSILGEAQADSVGKADFAFDNRYSAAEDGWFLFSALSNSQSSQANNGQLNILGEAQSGSTTLASSLIGLDRSDVAGFLGKPQQGEIIVYPEWDGHTYKGGNALFSPPSFANAVPILDAISVSSDIAVDGDIVGGEIDLFSIDLVAGETYLFSVYGSGANALGDTFLYVIDDTLALLDFDDDGGAGVNSLITYTATYTGTHNIGVGAYPDSGLTGDYTLDAILDPGIDFVPDTLGGAAPLAMNGVTYGFIDSAAPGPYGPGTGEVDTYSFNVQAGMIYTIEVAGGADYASDYLNLPAGELDTIALIYDSNGSLVTQNDDISFPSDVSSRVSFLAEETGTYFLDVVSYAPWTGGFSITAQEIDLANLDPVDALNWASADNVPFDANNTAYVYFGAAGENFGELADDGVSPMVTFGWNAHEIDQVMAALEEYEKILGVNYEITTDINEATFRLSTTSSNNYGAYFYPQDPGFGSAQGIGVFNVDSGGWAFDQQQSLVQGGFSFAVILHEFGHAHGVAHPHDQGGGSEVLVGVTSSTGSLGVFDLNQGVYTVMSYNDAWETHPDGPSPFTAAGIDNGWSGTLSAFDIATLQERYGVINPYATGDDVYTLQDVQAQGTYYETIWDTGGKDTIQYDGASDAVIDLFAATIDYTPTGGGVVSYVDGIWGGYTIAEGVVIENATGGDGNDALLGNAADNVIRGNGGDDTLVGREGADKLYGGAGLDIASYVDAASAVKASLLWPWANKGDAKGDHYHSIEGLQGSAFDDKLTGNFGANYIDGFDGDDKIYSTFGDDTVLGGAGNDTVYAGLGDDVVDGGDGDDRLYGGFNNDTIDGGAGNDTLKGGFSNDVLNGGDGDDSLDGGFSNDVLNGGAGNDKMKGGWGNDTFAFTETGGADQILDFRSGKDKVDVSGLDAIDGGAIDAFDWIGSGAFSGTAGELRAYSAGGNDYFAGDTDGDGIEDFIVQTNVLLSESDFIFV